MKKWILNRSVLALALILALALPLSGCRMIRLNPERDAAVVLATVGDQTITKGEFNQQWELYRKQMGITDAMLASASYASLISTYKTGMLDQMVSDELIKVEARLYGSYNFTQAENEKIQQDIDDLLASFEQSGQSQFDDEDMTEEEKARAVAEWVADFREQYGYTDEYLWNLYADQLAYDKLYEQITGDLAPTEAFVQQAYTSLLEEHRTTYATDTEAYIRTYMSGSKPLYIPAGLRMVQQILIKLPDDVANQLMTLRSEGKDGEADALRQEELAKILPDAQDMLDRIDGGEDFSALMTEFSEDTGAQEFPDGYPVAAGTTQFVEAFTEAAMGLSSIGAVSGLVETDYGYHILRFHKVLTSGDVPYEEARTYVTETATASMAQEAWNTQIETWTAELGVKTYYDRLG